MRTDLDLLEQLRFAFQLQQLRIGAEGTLQALELHSTFFEGNISEREYAAAGLLVEHASHERAVANTVEYIGTTRSLSLPRARHAEPVRDPFDARAAKARLKAAIDFRRTFDHRDDLGPIPGRSRSANLYAKKTAVETNRTVLNAGRRTVLQSATANRVRWRRITSAKPCSFCIYQAALTANYANLNNGLVHYYHDFCGCSVTEVYGDGQISPREHAEIDAVERARQACKDEGISLTPKNITSKMRELADADHVHDAVPPKTQTGGAGGGGDDGDEPPRPPSTDRAGEEQPQKFLAEYIGPLGRRGEVHPPSVGELKEYLAPEQSKWAEFSADELRVATWLKKNLGIELWSLRRRSGEGEVTPDALLLDLSASMELKMASTSQALLTQARKARKQSQRFTAWSGMTDPAEVQAAVSDVLRSYGEQFEELVVIFDDGASYVHWKHD